MTGVDISGLAGGSAAPEHAVSVRTMMKIEILINAECLGYTLDHAFLYLFHARFMTAMDDQTATDFTIFAIG
ncbi:hypothetical protein J14TS5_48090 [Paenibacillus lautus]|nr:hypothetical protein J14TS5_48090 [Paenibacillus lautus]